MQFELLRQTRKNQLSLIDSLDIDQLNFIPAGFNNNLIWNLGHVVITQQLLCYKLSNNRLLIDGTLVERYRKGSRPEVPVEENEVQLIKEYILSTAERLETDFQSGVFESYNNYFTSYGITLNNIEDAILFNNSHEAMHLGTMIALRKLVE